MKLSDARLAELERLIVWSHDVGGDVQQLGELAGDLLAEVRELRKREALGSFARAVAAATPCSCSAQRRRADEAEAKLARIERAYNDPGRYPPLHERVKGFTRRDWPTLTAAIEAAIR